MLRRSTEILAGRIYKVPSEWMTGGPGQSNHILEQLCRRDTWRRKRRGDRGVYVPSHPNAAVRSTSRASPNFASRGIRERQIGLSDAGFPRSVARRSSKPERSLDERREWIESTEDKLLTIDEEILWHRTTHNQSAKVNRKRHQLLPHSKPQSIRGLMMGSRT